jgi:DNA-binding HxlR family transcriptional regulator
MECKPGLKEVHKKEMRAIQDSMDVLSGKWKIAILTSICLYNKRRFSDVLNEPF